MSLESILGITASVIAIGTLAYQGFQKFQRMDISDMMTALADKNTSIKKQHRILVKMNWNLQSTGKSISKEYIKSFSSNGRSKSVIFHDICLTNNIEPTKDLCVRVLGYDEPSFRGEWLKKNQTLSGDVAESVSINQSNVESQRSKPIQDWDTDFVYISDKLKVFVPEFHQRLCQKFSEMGISYGEIRGTKDIWCRDYMPIQTSADTFIGYKYNPDYLNSDEVAYPGIARFNEIKCSDVISDQNEVWRQNGMPYELEKTKLILDGGNVVLSEKYVLLTHKVFKENNCKSKDDEIKLLESIKQIFGREPVIIPWKSNKDDAYGHADGMVKPMRSSKSKPAVMISPIFKYEKDSLKEALKDKFEINELTFVSRGNNFEKYAWAYINFLQVGNKILVPSFGLECEASVMEQIRAFYPDCIVDSIDMKEIAVLGGALHCITWNIKK